MLNVIDVANYFLKKDKNRQLFNKKLIQRNGRTFYEGNARINIYNLPKMFILPKQAKSL